MSSRQQIVLNPIGIVRTDAIGNEVKDKTKISKIILNPELVEALEGDRRFFACIRASLAQRSSQPVSGSKVSSKRKKRHASARRLRA